MKVRIDAPVNRLWTKLKISFVVSLRYTMHPKTDSRFGPRALDEPRPYERTNDQYEEQEKGNAILPGHSK